MHQLNEPAIVRIGNVSLLLGRRSRQHRLVRSDFEVSDGRLLLSKPGNEGGVRGVIMCLPTLLIFVNIHLCVDV